jgi:hypothetical protein
MTLSPRRGRIRILRAQGDRRKPRQGASRRRRVRHLPTLPMSWRDSPASIDQTSARVSFKRL